MQDLLVANLAATCVVAVVLVVATVFAGMCLRRLGVLVSWNAAMADANRVSVDKLLEANRTSNDALLAAIGKSSEKALKELAETRESTARIGNEVARTFLEADDSFKQMLDGLKDVENMQQIKLRADEILQLLLQAHEKIASQVAMSGKITEELHELVVIWSKEGTDLQKAHKALARTVEEAVTREAATREKLALQLETVLQNAAGGRHVA